MKIISSTSITSTIGVTLISAITALRRPRRAPPLEAPAPLIPMISGPQLPHTPSGSCSFIDLPRQDRGELVGGPLQALGLPVHLGDKLFVENCRRNGGDQADWGGKKRLRDAGGPHRQRGVLGGRDRLEARHDAPDRAEQAHE